MIAIRQFDPICDYVRFCGWWAGHGWDAPPLIFLPSLAVVACWEGVPVAAGWCYLDNSCPVAKLEWLVADPDPARAREVLKGLHAVIAFLSERVAEPDLGYLVLLTTARQPGLIKILEKHEFVKTDEGMTHLLLIVDQQNRAKFKASIAKNDATGTLLADYQS